MILRKWKALPSEMQCEEVKKYYDKKGSAETLPSDYSLKISIVEFSHKLLDKLLNLVSGFLNGNFI